MRKSKQHTARYPDQTNGIYLYEYPMIHGIRQYVQVRGTDRNNPLILFLHGGPGSSMAGLCHVLQAGWEEQFTVVNWDQRNTCKTYFANQDRAMEIAKTGTLEDYIQDIDEVIAYLHTVYTFDKLILMGFSWGSAIGSAYAQRHPENLLCYIGVGQHISYLDGIRFICDKLSELAAGNQKDILKIKAIAESVANEPKMTKQFMKNLRSYIALGTKYIAKSGKAFPLKAVLTSPFLSFKEKYAVVKSDPSLLEGTFATMMTYDFREDMRFAVPVLFLSGAEDFSCPVDLLRICFAGVTAPDKRLEIIPQAAHACLLDQSEMFYQKMTAFVDCVIQNRS